MGRQEGQQKLRPGHSVPTHWLPAWGALPQTSGGLPLASGGSLRVLAVWGEGQQDRGDRRLGVL